MAAGPLFWLRQSVAGGEMHLPRDGIKGRREVTAFTQRVPLVRMPLPVAIRRFLLKGRKFASMRVEVRSSLARKRKCATLELEVCFTAEARPERMISRVAFVIAFVAFRIVHCDTLLPGGLCGPKQRNGAGHGHFHVRGHRRLLPTEVDVHGAYRLVSKRGLFRSLIEMTGVDCAMQLVAM